MHPRAAEQQIHGCWCQKTVIGGWRGRWQLLHLVGLGADVALRLFEARDGAVAEAAHHRHQRVEVLQLEQLLWKDEENNRMKTGSWGDSRREGGVGYTKIHLEWATRVLNWKIKASDGKTRDSRRSCSSPRAHPLHETNLSGRDITKRSVLSVSKLG